MAGSLISDDGFLSLQEALAGRYSIERELGRGGMGVVYLAHDVGLDRPVAIKLLPPAHAAQAELRERFLREARTAARLSHPHIVPIHLVDEVGDFVFFVMAYVEGETLGHRVRERGPLPVAEASRILREVAWALAYAHAHGVVHRDVKPDNVLLEAGSGRALVTDFGIARVGSGGLTGAHEILGTPEYMSPEQAAGEAVDGRSDLYSLGVVAHFALTGSLPFRGQSAQATLAKVLTQPAPALRSLVPTVPASLAGAVDRCLEKDPASRLGGAEEMADVLGGLLAERRSVPGPIRRFQEENNDSASVVMGLLVLMAVMAAVLLVSAGTGEMPLEEILLALVGLAAWWTIPVGMLAVIARRLLRAGYGHDELVRALRAEVMDRREALGEAARPRNATLDVAARGSATGGFGLMVAAVVMILIPDVPAPWIQTSLLGGAALGGVGTLVAAARGSFHRPVSGERWLSFWEGLAGRMLFRVAGLGLGRRAKTDGASYRPTELAIGMAAERLYGDLPRDVRKLLGDLPGVVAGLEAHADRMRARITELDRLLREVGDGDDAGAPARSAHLAQLDERRGSISVELRQARDAAETRLRQVVAALERLRLELLRLHAGSGSVDSMTADLGAARALSEEMGHLHEGQREVALLLGDAPYRMR